MNGKLGSRAYLEDYANLSLAALALFEVTGDEYYLDKAKDWTSHLNHHFWDDEKGGYNFSAHQIVPGLNVEPKPIHDNATPAGNGLMANLLCQLYHLTGATQYQTRFDEVLKVFGSSEPTRFSALPGSVQRLFLMKRSKPLPLSAIRCGMRLMH